MYHALFLVKIYCTSLNMITVIDSTAKNYVHLGCMNFLFMTKHDFKYSILLYSTADFLTLYTKFLNSYNFMVIALL